MREGNSRNEQQGACVGWVPDIFVKSRCHELVLRVHGEIEGEQVTELMETAHADKHPESSHHDPEQEHGSD